MINNKSQKLIAEGFPGQRLSIIPPAILNDAKKKPICNNLLPTHLGMFKSAKNHYILRPQGTPEMILIACIAGKGSCTINQNTWELSQGNLILLPANTFHCYKANAQMPWSIFWLHFTGRLVNDYLQQLEYSLDNPMMHISNISGLIDAFEDIYQHTRHGYTETSLLCLSTSFARFLGLCRLYQRANSSAQRSVENRVNKSVQIMRESLHRMLTLDELANASGWSTPHYCVMFKKYKKIPPMEFYARLKFQQACDRLKLTSEPINVIASTFGFDDPLYFSRAFKRYIGMSPRQYRKNFNLLNL